ncbi:MAG: putative monovalent cation/H+ antiporter subunit A [Rhizobiaceae bacterium]|nr:putative monovalent cation/H+ antiporter subunit A [Rhizobiaceae bacterium]
MLHRCKCCCSSTARVAAPKARRYSKQVRSSPQKDQSQKLSTLVALLLPFAAAAIAPVATRLQGHRAAWLLAAAPAAIFLHFLSMLPAVAAGDTLNGGVDWVPSLDVRLSWMIDGLSLAFALLISGIGMLIVLYAGGYLKGHPHQGRFFAFILLFMGSMQGLVLSDSFLTLFVFWELTSVTSFLLIGFDHGREAARRAALQALVVTGIGGLALLAGLLIIWGATGKSDMSGLLASGEALRESPLYVSALLLVLGGAFTKSAQFPFHFWLPNAMEAPTPVSAYLHSATMVKAGVYLLMRLNPAMGGTPLWETLLPLFGAATLLCGALLALRQTDLKLMLAYTTVASLGLLVMLTGLGSDKAVEAAALYLVAHSLFKGALFMVAGSIDHEAGTRDIRGLAGLRSAMPVTFAAGLLAALSMCGLPLLVGFLAKEEIYAALGFADGWTAALTVAVLLGNAAMLVIALNVGLKPFVGALPRLPGQPHEAPLLLWLGPAVLAVAGLLAGVVSTPFHRWISSPLATAIAGEPIAIHISTIPHLGVPLLLSALTIGLGICAWLASGRLREGVASLLAAIGWGPDRGFDQAMRGLIRLSRIVTGVVQCGRLVVYMTVTFIVAAISVLGPMAASGEWPAWPALPDLYFYEWLVFLLAAVGALAVLLARSRLTAIVCLGIQGFAIALLFMLFGAPDLSFTQFMVETLSVVILALVMTRLRLLPTDRRPGPHKIVDGAIAVAAGVAFGLLLLKVTQVPFDGRLTDFFNAYSRTIAHGRNVVNVIIVDFRGLDTLGEIAVVMIAGLAILALIRIRGRRIVAARREA